MRQLVQPNDPFVRNLVSRFLSLFDRIMTLFNGKQKRDAFTNPISDVWCVSKHVEKKSLGPHHECCVVSECDCVPIARASWRMEEREREDNNEEMYFISLLLSSLIAFWYLDCFDLSLSLSTFYLPIQYQSIPLNYLSFRLSIDFCNLLQWWPNDPDIQKGIIMMMNPKRGVDG